MPDRKQRNVGPFPAFLSSDHRAGRFVPESFARFAGIDPAMAQRYMRGTLPIPATLIVPLVEFTRNTVYVDTLLDRLGLAAVPKPEGSTGSSAKKPKAGDQGNDEYRLGAEQLAGCDENLDFDELKDVAVDLVGDAALLQRAIAQWMDGPAKLGSTNQAAARSWLLNVVRHAAAISRFLSEERITEDLNRVADVLSAYGESTR